MHPDLRPDLLLGAYATGIFPMADDEGQIMWFCPDPRAVIPLDGVRISHDLRRRCRSGLFTITVDVDFEGVIRACANRAEGTWISADIIEAFLQLHRLGFAHSVESRSQGRLVGGLYGIALGGAFFGESMFYHVSDASKVALVHLCERLKQRGYSLLDVQVLTPHLQRFGALEIPRREYLRRLDFALSQKRTFADEPDDISIE